MINVKHLLFALGILLFACKQEDSPDLAQISKEYCEIAQPCDFDKAWDDLERCEAYSAEEYETARTNDKMCFDARIVMETCIGSFESCDEYAKFENDADRGCKQEFMDFYIACRLP